MPKKHYREAPAQIRARIERALEQTTLEREDGQGFIHCGAAGQLAAMNLCYSAGFDFAPEDVARPAHEKLEKLIAAGDGVEISRFRTRAALELKYEKLCINRANGMRAWAATPNREEVQEQERAARAASAREAQIDARAAEIQAERVRERVERTRAAARKQAAKELTS